MLRFYDLNFNLIGEVDTFTSLQFNRSWYGCGDVELHVNRYAMLNARTKTKLWDRVYETITNTASEIVIMLDNDPKKTAIIHTDSCSFSEKGKGSEDLVLRGTELKYLSHRVVTSSYEDTASAEDTIKALISANQGDNAGSRQLSNFSVEESLGRGNSVYFKSLYQFLDVELNNIATSNDVGWWYEFNPDELTITAKFGVGIDRTQSQNIIAPILFKQGDNLATAEYTHSDVTYSNVIVAKGKAENDTVTNITKTYGSATGYTRREEYKEFDVVITADENPFSNLDNAVEQYIASIAPQIYLTGTPQINGVNKYGSDFDLGDIITLQAFGLTTDARITNVLEVLEGGKARAITLTFGRPFQTFPSMVYKEISNIKKMGATQ